MIHVSEVEKERKSVCCDDEKFKKKEDPRALRCGKQVGRRRASIQGSMRRQIGDEDSQSEASESISGPWSR
jgi:hypothetical protein